MKNSIAISIMAVLIGMALQAKGQTGSDIYRYDDIGAGIGKNANFENGHGLLGMGVDDYSLYEIGKYSLVSATQCTITREMAAENWGARYDYTFEAAEDMDVNIKIKHCVPWEGWAKYSNHANNIRNQYVISGAPQLDWVSRYYASMVLLLDGNSLATAQTARPLAPTEYEADGTTFNKILTDKSQWESTLVNGEANDTLWLWPKEGGNNEHKPYYNDTPEYVKVHLTKGTHTLTVTSLCSGWDFDCLQIEDYATSGIEAMPENAHFTAYCKNGTVFVGSNEEAQLYNSYGQLVKTFRRQTQVSQGIYILKCGGNVKKLYVK